MLIAGALEKRIIDYEAVCTGIGCKFPDMGINDFLRKQCSKSKPVRFYVGQKAVIGIFGKVDSFGLKLSLHIKRTIPKYIAQDVRK